MFLNVSRFKDLMNALRNGTNKIDTTFDVNTFKLWMECWAYCEVVRMRKMKFWRRIRTI